MSFLTKILLLESFLILCLSTSLETINFPLTKKIPTLDEHLTFIEVALQNQNDQTKSPTFDFKLENFKNSQYIGKIYVGSNQQPFNVVFDTGSHFLVIPGAPLRNKFSHSFNCDASSTCIPYDDDSVTLKYGSGNGKGYVVEDEVSLGDGLTAQNTTFVVATILGQLPVQFHADGILGLREVGDPAKYFTYPNVDTIVPTKYSFIDNLYTQGLIAKKQFSFFLNDEGATTQGLLGADFTLGGHNPDYVRSNFTFLDVVDGNYWAVQLNSLKVGSMEIKTSRKMKAAIDTGTSVITFPKDIYELFVKVILETTRCEEMYQIMCTCKGSPCGIKPEEFPTIVLEFDNMRATLPGRSYVVDVSGYSVLDIYGLDISSDNLIILGDPFMRQYVTLFDAEEDRIGLAESVNFIEPSVPNRVDDRRIALIILFVGAGLILLVIGIYLCRRYKKKAEDNIRLLDANRSQEIAMTDVHQQAI